MKHLLFILVLTSFSAHASPFMNVKERLRLHLWAFGLEDTPQVSPKKVVTPKKRPLPEELVRTLHKL